MAIVRAFRGLRPRSDVAAEVASPPYDVLSSDEARELAQNNPNSFLRVNKAEIDFPPGTDQYSVEVYDRGKQNLENLQSSGLMVRDDKDSLYLYRLTWQGRQQTGLVALTSVVEYDAGKIKKHEHTRPEKVNDRANHIDHLQAQVGPVFSTFRYDETIDNIFKRITSGTPTTSFDADDGVKHELWVVDEADNVREIVDAFAKLNCLYIADGHHRSQSASEVCRRRKEKNPNHTGNEIYNFFLNVLFADSELRILSYNRVVSELNNLTPDELVKHAEKKFDVALSDTPVDPANLHEMGMYIDGRWYKMTPKAGTFDPSHPTKSIDSAILSESLLGPALGITDLRTDKRIDFIGGIRGIKELIKRVDSGECKAAFSLFPTSIEQLLNVADAGEVMPPKSTWFEPKLRSGMVVNLLTD